LNKDYEDGIMNVEEYNEWHKKYSHASSFIHCIDHALEKSGENAKMQFSVIGWSPEMKKFLNEAIECYYEKKHSEIIY